MCDYCSTLLSMPSSCLHQKFPLTWVYQPFMTRFGVFFYLVENASNMFLLENIFSEITVLFAIWCFIQMDDYYANLLISEFLLFQESFVCVGFVHIQFHSQDDLGLCQIFDNLGDTIFYNFKLFLVFMVHSIFFVHQAKE